MPRSKSRRDTKKRSERRKNRDKRARHRARDFDKMPFAKQVKQAGFVGAIVMLVVIVFSIIAGCVLALFNADVTTVWKAIKVGGILGVVLGVISFVGHWLKSEPIIPDE